MLSLPTVQVHGVACCPHETDGAYHSYIFPDESRILFLLCGVCGCFLMNEMVRTTGKKILVSPPPSHYSPM